MSVVVSKSDTERRSLEEQIDYAESLISARDLGRAADLLEDLCGRALIEEDQGALQRISDLASAARYLSRRFSRKFARLHSLAERNARVLEAQTDIDSLVEPERAPRRGGVLVGALLIHLGALFGVFIAASIFAATVLSEETSDPEALGWAAWALNLAFLWFGALGLLLWRWSKFGDNQGMLARTSLMFALFALFPPLLLALVSPRLRRFAGLVKGPREGPSTRVAMPIADISELPPTRLELTQPSRLALVEEGSPATLVRRLASLALDSLVLLAGLVVAMLVGLSLAAGEEIIWLLLAWALGVTPLYFALYHAFGTGSTPGQQEVGIGLRDMQSGGRISLGRALGRAYGGLAAVALVVPALLDLASAAFSPDRRLWHDRLTGGIVAHVPPSKRALSPWPPSSPGLRPAFEPEATTRGLLARSWQLFSSHRRALFMATFSVYAGLVLLVAVLAPLIVADFEDEFEAAFGVATWALLAVILFVSGAYWTQAALVTTLESLRIGEDVPSAGEILRQGTRRANALTAALLLLLAPAMWIAYLFPFAPLFARFGLVVPAIAVEDARVLGAFRRSWQLTQGATWRAFGLLVVSAAAVAATLGVSLTVAFAVVGAAVPDAGPLGFALASALAMLVVSVPVSAILAFLGTVWCLFYYELRDRQRRSTGSEVTCSR